MNKYDNKQQQVDDVSKPAEIDLSKYEMGANYDVANLTVVNPDPAMHYHLATKEGTVGTVSHCLGSGYVVSDKKVVGNPEEFQLMEIPLVVHQSRQRSRQAAEIQKVRALSKVEKELKHLPGHKHGVEEGRIIKE